MKIIKSKKEYSMALEQFEKKFQAKQGTAESDQADVLALLIRQYEDKHFVIEAPGPLEAIRYRMDQQGLTNTDLAGILGYKSRVTDLFRQHRKLSIGLIRKLHSSLQIPLETLIKEY